jgi:hypothetical protein
MNRREFIAGLGGAAVWPIAVGRTGRVRAGSGEPGSLWVFQPSNQVRRPQ